MIFRELVPYSSTISGRLSLTASNSSCWSRHHETAFSRASPARQVQRIHADSTWDLEQIPLESIVKWINRDSPTPLVIPWCGAVLLWIYSHFVHFDEWQPIYEVSNPLLSNLRINLTEQIGCQAISVRRCFSKYSKKPVWVDFADWLYSRKLP